MVQRENRRDEPASTELTGNPGLEPWGQILGEQVMAALVDRVRHRGHRTGKEGQDGTPAGCGRPRGGRGRDRPGVSRDGCHIRYPWTGTGFRPVPSVRNRHDGRRCDSERAGGAGCTRRPRLAVPDPHRVCFPWTGSRPWLQPAAALPPTDRRGMTTETHLNQMTPPSTQTRSLQPTCPPERSGSVRPTGEPA